ncbi:MAG: DEAD/DEAH box helicase [Proteobacteria bacterium]|nr:DEAD/DEAH box helicase [Pseudomonadota bacterium]
MTFEDLGLSPEILAAVEKAGYREPTPIQRQAIPIALQGRDLLGCAQTGTGKTAAFVLPMIDILAGGRAKARMPRALILSPTRELAQQTMENFEIYAADVELTPALLIGGSDMKKQEQALNGNIDVLIATPGRLLDMVERGHVLMMGVKHLIIDEADRMLDMGFIPDIEKIVERLPPLRQTLMFSATMPREIRKLAERFLHNPKEVTVAPPASPAETVEQVLVAVANERDKGKALRYLLEHEPVTSAMIFSNRKKDVDSLHRSLKRYGYNCVRMQGDMAQREREVALGAFKSGEAKIIVCTDVAGRGIDVFGISHVFCFDVPVSAEDYVHRIGRTGRAGHRGHAFTFATPDDAKGLAAVTRLIKRSLPVVDVEGIKTAEIPGFTPGAANKPRGGAAVPVVPEVAPAEAAAETPAQEVVAEATETAVPESVAAEVQSEAPAEEAKAPRRRRSRGHGKKAAEAERTEPEAAAEEADGASEDAAEAAAEAQKPARRSDPRPEKTPARNDKPASDGRVAFGDTDQVPAFLLRSAFPNGVDAR